MHIKQIVCKFPIADSKVALQITSLAALCPPRGVIKRIAECWKPSTKECETSIINHVKVLFSNVFLVIVFTLTISYCNDRYIMPISF